MANTEWIDVESSFRKNVQDRMIHCEGREYRWTDFFFSSSQVGYQRGCYYIVMPKPAALSKWSGYGGKSRVMNGNYCVAGKSNLIMGYTFFLLVSGGMLFYLFVKLFQSN